MKNRNTIVRQVREAMDEMLNHLANHTDITNKPNRKWQKWCSAFDALRELEEPDEVLKPGTWSLDTAGTPLIINGPDQGNGNIVAIIPVAPNQHGYPEEIALANARAIVQVPELLEAIRTGRKVA